MARDPYLKFSIDEMLAAQPFVMPGHMSFEMLYGGNNFKMEEWFPGYKETKKEQGMQKPGQEIPMPPLKTFGERRDELFLGLGKDVHHYVAEHDLQAYALHMLEKRMRGEEPDGLVVETRQQKVLWQEIQNRVRPLLEAEYHDEGIFTEDWDDEVPIRTEAKTIPGTRTIDEIIVMRDFLEMAKPPKDFSMWNDIDKELLGLGVRVGQLWSVRTTDRIVAIAPIGYHKKGFVWVEIKQERAVWPPVIRANKSINSDRAQLIRDLRSRNALLSASIHARCLDENGFPLPGWEVETALASFLLRPMFWKDPASNEDSFLSFCDKGHFVFSSRQLGVGCPCGPDCIDSKRSAAATSLFDSITARAIRTEVLKSFTAFVSTCPAHKYVAFRPYLLSDTRAEARRMTDAFSQVKVKSPAHLPMEREETPLGKTTLLFQQEGVRSGDIFPFQIQETGESIFAKAHRRACGFFHFELSKTMTFSGSTDKTLLSRILRTNRFSLGEFGKEIELGHQTPMIHCHICKSEDPIFIMNCEENPYYEENRKYIPRLRPITPTNIKKCVVPSSGDIVLIGKKPAIVDETFSVTTRLGIRSAGRISCKTHRGLKLKVDLGSIRIIDNPTEALRKLFYDDDGFLIQKKLGLSNWMKIIWFGTKLIAVREDLYNQTVTCASPPFKLGSEWFVSVAESERPMNLHTELRLKKTYPISMNGAVQIGHKHYRVNDIIEGTVYLSDPYGNQYKIPKIGMDILFSHNSAKTVVIVSPIDLAHDAGLISSAEAADMSIERMRQNLKEHHKLWKKKKARKGKRHPEPHRYEIAIEEKAATPRNPDLDEWLADNEYATPNAPVAPIPVVPAPQAVFRPYRPGG